MGLLSSFMCGQFQIKKESAVADCVFEKRDKRRLSVQGVILRLICSPMGLSLSSLRQSRKVFTGRSEKRSNTGSYNQTNRDILPFQDHQNPNMGDPSSSNLSRSQPYFNFFCHIDSLHFYSVNKFYIVLNLKNCEISFDILQLFLSWEG